MSKILEDLLPVLRCPRSHTSLQIVSGALVSQTGETFPVVENKPILVRQITAIHITSPGRNIISQNIPEFRTPEWVSSPDALILHLGSGNVPSSDPRVISLDVIPCENVDIVGEAEELPFLDQMFDYVESGAVFEHLYDPIKAIKEVRRILKPGGRFRIDTAFMQGYHGYPGHYFNMTPQAIETFLVDDFNLELSTVPDSATPVHTVLDTLERFLYYIPTADRSILLDQPLKDVLETLKVDQTRTNPLLVNYDEYPLRILCASFVVIAQKPETYDFQIKERLNEGEQAYIAWQTLKREYYTARQDLIFRHHEVRLYIRLSKEKGKINSGLREPKDLNSILDQCKPTSMLELEGVRYAIASLQANATELIALRDQWIHLYSGSQSANNFEVIEDLPNARPTKVSKILIRIAQIRDNILCYIRKLIE